jgi:hypothetical protein
MAQKVLVELIDDIDGTPGDDVTSVVFGLDGVEYAIDLNEDNAERLREILGEFVDVARRTGGRVKRGTSAGGKKTAVAPRLMVVPTSAHRPKEVTQAIREWARANGHDIADRGRIPAAVLEAYDDAHQPEPASKPRPPQRAGRQAVSPRFTG